MAVSIGPGWSIGPGVALGTGGGGSVSPGIDNVAGYAEMPPPVTPGVALEDPTATVNSPTGFTINDATKTGIAMTGLTSSNVNWVIANLGVGIHNVTWGPGSTVASSSITISQMPVSWPGQFVFFVIGQSGPATYNYPFTFSV